MTTYGEFNAGLFAGRDIGFDSFSGSKLAGVTGSGDIRGLISAGRNIQNDIISHGTINATFYALNTAQTSDGGKIGNIIAWGSIAGLVVAESSLGNLRSGDAITATLDAPQIGTITEFDSDVVTDFPMPTVPASVKGTILADAAIIRAELDAEKQATEDVFTQFAQDTEAIRLDTANAIQKTRKDTQSRVDQAHDSLQDQLDDDRESAQKIIDRTRRSAGRVISSIKTKVKETRELLKTNVANVKKAREAAFQRANAQAAEAKKMVERFDAQIEKRFQKVLKLSQKERAAFFQYMRQFYDRTYRLYLLALKTKVDMRIYVPAILSRGAYEANFSPIIGDYVVVENGVFVDENSGGRAVLYQNTKTGEYVLAFAGTAINRKDLGTDLWQGLGDPTAQYQWAINLADKLHEEYGNKLSFVGHSLGGGLATAAALRTGLRATVFNPSGLHKNTIERHNLQIERAKELITVYRLQGEPLTTIQDSNLVLLEIPVGWIMPDTIGDVHTIPDPYWDELHWPWGYPMRSFDNHGMDRLIEQLLQNAINDL